VARRIEFWGSIGFSATSVVLYPRGRGPDGYRVREAAGIFEGRGVDGRRRSALELRAPRACQPLLAALEVLIAEQDFWRMVSRVFPSVVAAHD